MHWRHGAVLRLAAAAKAGWATCSNAHWLTSIEGGRDVVHGAVQMMKIPLARTRGSEDEGEEEAWLLPCCWQRRWARRNLTVYFVKKVRQKLDKDTRTETFIKELAKSEHEVSTSQPPPPPLTTLSTPTDESKTVRSTLDDSPAPTSPTRPTAP